LAAVAAADLELSFRLRLIWRPKQPFFAPTRTARAARFNALYQNDALRNSAALARMQTGVQIHGALSQEQKGLVNF